MKIDYFKLEKKIDCKFKNKNLLVQSLTHKSFNKMNNNEKIEIKWDSQVEEVLSDEQGVTGVKIRNSKTNEVTEIECTGYFSAIGHKPNTEVFSNYLETDEVGYLIADGVKTSIPGIYAAGDVADRIYRQAVTAAGTGCMAALDAEKYLSELEN